MVCFPLNDTEYDAADMGAFMACRTRGVFSAEGHFGVSAAGGMTVLVEPGVAWLKMEEAWGVVAQEKAATTLTVEPGHGVLDRIDAVCLQLDKNENVARLTVKKGALAAEPEAAPPQRNLYYDEIYLATVKVPAGTTELTQAQITDTRMDEALCGLMRDGVSGLPTAQLQAQAEDLIRLLEERLQGVMSGNDFMLKADYAPDATAAISGGRLYVTSTHPRAGTQYEVKFTAPADQGDIPVTIDGADVTVVDLLGKPVAGAWMQGAPVTLSRKGPQAFFKAGGGAGGTPVIVGGTARPQDPEDNTIWAYGAWSPGKIHYGATPPEMAESGDIWLLAGQSNVTVTLDGISYSPIGVMQYQNAEFVALGAVIYAGGSWTPLYSLEELQYHSPLSTNAANTIDPSIACTTGAGMTFVADDTAGRVAQGDGSSGAYSALVSERFNWSRNNTIVCAYKTTSTAADRYILGIGNTLDNQSVNLMLNAGALKLFGYGSTGYAVTHTSRLTNDGQWHAGAGATNYVDTTGCLYVDGDFAASGPFKVYTSAKYLNLMSRPGSNPALATVTFNGRLANLFFYSRTLGAYEARTLTQTLRLRAQGVI